MKAMGLIFRSERRFRAAQRLGDWRSRLWLGKTVGSAGCRGMLGGWTQARDLQEMPKETFRDWWEKRGKNGN